MKTRSGRAPEASRTAGSATAKAGEEARGAAEVEAEDEAESPSAALHTTASSVGRSLMRSAREDEVPEADAGEAEKEAPPQSMPTFQNNHCETGYVRPKAP